MTGSEATPDHPGHAPLQCGSSGRQRLVAHRMGSSYMSARSVPATCRRGIFDSREAIIPALTRSASRRDEAAVLLAKGDQLGDGEAFLIQAPAGEARLASQRGRLRVLNPDQARQESGRTAVSSLVSAIERMSTSTDSVAAQGSCVLELVAAHQPVSVNSSRRSSSVSTRHRGHLPHRNGPTQPTTTGRRLPA